jgi:hypothetical protein
VDDRVLLVPPVFAPDPDVLRSWASPGILISRLNDRWPVDFVRWPTIKGTATSTGGSLEALVQAVRAVITPQHHVVDISFGGGSLTLGLWECPPRSLSVAGFVGTLASLRAAGHPELADATQISQSIITVPGQFLPFIMQGATPQEIEAAERQLDATLDKEALAEVFEAVADVVFAELVTLDVPAVFFVLPTPFPGGEVEYEIYQTLVPGVKRDELSIWPGEIHRVEGGNELADKVIPFIEGVIAARGG